MTTFTLFATFSHYSPILHYLLLFQLTHSTCCISAQVHLNQMDKLPPQHVMKHEVLHRLGKEKLHLGILGYRKLLNKQDIGPSGLELDHEIVLCSKIVPGLISSGISNSNLDQRLEPSGSEVISCPNNHRTK
ncbi:hypothetical protein AMECASPLE_016260 [Ameca splendens]|uniref:Uncharacterized protein n=1 Tax=Ameca splendens TaxID=208324 RepID=A0ABV1AAQ1_9TELE